MLAAENFKIIVFVGASQTKVTFEAAAALQRMGDKAEYVKISGNGPNALDFHMSYYLGTLSKEHPEGFHGFPNPNADYQKYFDYMEGQVKELLTNYGPVGIIWFDWWGAAFNAGETKNIARAHAFVDSIHK